MGTERKKNDGAAMDRKKQTEQTKPEEETRAGQPSARVDLSSGEYTYTDGTPTPEEGGGQSAQGEDTRKPSHPSQPPPPHRCGFCGASFAAPLLVQALLGAPVLAGCGPEGLGSCCG